MTFLTRNRGTISASGAWRMRITTSQQQGDVRDKPQTDRRGDCCVRACEPCIRSGGHHQSGACGPYSPAPSCQNAGATAPTPPAGRSGNIDGPPIVRPIATTPGRLRRSPQQAQSRARPSAPQQPSPQRRLRLGQCLRLMTSRGALRRPGLVWPVGYHTTRNGIICRPGTMFKGSDGLMHLCQ